VVPPSQRDSAISAAVVIGSALLFVLIIAVAAFQLRRAAKDPGLARDDPDTGALDTADSQGQHS
jgi:hypothetical protein